MSDTEKTETRKERFTRQTKEHYELIGRFVQEFEFFVMELRSCCQSLILADHRQANFINILLHHGALTASPLFEIMRAMVAEALKDENRKIPKKDKELIEAILNQYDAEARSLIAARNNILHGTWFTGWASSKDEDFSEMKVYKHKASRHGFVRAETPKDATELRKMIVRCNVLRNVVALVKFGLIIPSEMGVRMHFALKDKVWVPTRILFGLAP